MEIKFNNKIFNGKYQALIFLILDINDWCGKPLTFVIGNNNTFKNFHINATNWNKKSSKYEVGKWLFQQSKRKIYGN